MTRSLLALLFVAIPFSAFSATKAKQNPPGFAELQKAAPFQETEIKNFDVNAVVKKTAGEKNRRPASDCSLGENDLSPAYKNIRQKFWDVKTPEQLHALLEELDTNYESYTDNDAKVIATQVLPLRAFRGILWRLRSVFEKRAKAVHSVVLTSAKKMATRVNVYLPFNHTKVVFDYLASPYFVPSKARPGTFVEAATFEYEHHIQSWLASDVFRELKVSADRLAVLNLKKPTVWDQKFTFGPDAFKDSCNHYRHIGEIERLGTLSAIYAGLANISVIRSYNLNGSIDLAKDIGKLYGFDGFGWGSEVEGVSAQKVSDRVRAASSYFGTLLPDGEKWMGKALNLSRASVKYAHDVWVLSDSSQSSEELFLVNTGYLRVNREEIDHNIVTTKRVVLSEGTESLRSAVTGEVVSVNYATIFRKPPQDMKTFLPKTGDTKKTVSRQVRVGDKTVPITYRNYFEGAPATWQLDAYKPYFPATNTNDDVFKAVRVASHAGGNWLFFAE